MPGGAVISTTADVNRVEAPVTVKAYLMCAFASFGGIFFGYDSGYINGVNGDNLFVHSVQPGTPAHPVNGMAAALTSSHQSLITSILSCGTFFGALIAGDLSDIIGRKFTIIIGCGIYIVGESICVACGNSSVALTNVFQALFSKFRRVVSDSSSPVDSSLASVLASNLPSLSSTCLRFARAKSEVH